MRYNTARTDVSIYAFCRDDRTGQPKTGITAASVTAYYDRIGAAAVEITVSDLAALTTAHTDGGLKETGHGYYRFDLPDAVFASGSTAAAIRMVTTDALWWVDPMALSTQGVTWPTLASSLTSLEETDVTLYQHAIKPSLTLAITDADGNARDVSGETLIWNWYPVGSDEPEALYTRTSVDGHITVAGDGNNEVTLTYTATMTATRTSYRHALWISDGTNDEVLARGVLTVAQEVKEGVGD